MSGSILDSMTLREKIGQTVQLQLTDVDLRSEAATAEFLAKYPVGSLFAGNDIINIAGTRFDADGMIARCNRDSRIPLSVAGDLEYGAGLAVTGETVFPPPLALAAARDEKLAYDFGSHIAIEGRKHGYNWNFGPVVDLSYHWQSRTLVNRNFGDDPELTVRLASQVIRGMQDHGMSAAVKHFPGDGVDDRNQHFGASVNSLSATRWFETFGRVYDGCFAAGAHSVMAGHLSLPFIDKRVESPLKTPRPATLSRPILTKLLREMLGFDGIVVTDALIMGGFSQYRPREWRMLECLNAGADVMLWPTLDYFDTVERAIQDGKLDIRVLDTAVRRILAFKARQGLLGETPKTWSDPPRRPAAQVASEIAAKALTLVRNHRKLLPLDPARTKKILLHLAVPYSREIALPRFQPLIDALTRRGVEVELKINGNCLDMWKMEAAGKRFDAWLMIFDQSMHAVVNAGETAGDMAECLWTAVNSDYHNPVMVAIGNSYLHYQNPNFHTVVNAYGGDPWIQQALVPALFGEMPFRGRSPIHFDRP